MFRQLNNQNKGGEKASRKYPKCHSRKIQNGISEKSQLDRKTLSWRKHLSLESVFILRGISEKLKNRLKIWTTGDLSTEVLVQG
jgi:ribosomal protein L4